MDDAFVKRLYELLIQEQTKYQKEKLRSMRLEQQFESAYYKIKYYEEVLYLKLE